MSVGAWIIATVVAVGIVATIGWALFVLYAMVVGTAVDLWRGLARVVRTYRTGMAHRDF